LETAIDRGKRWQIATITTIFAYGIYTGDFFPTKRINLYELIHPMIRA
jgi:hypothetical protein